jgi:hypothetical protein
MINTAIAQFYMHKSGKVSANILYPDDNAIALLHPDDNSFKNKKIYYNGVDLYTFEAYFKSAGFREASLLVEATLEKYRKGLLLSYKSSLHALNTNEIEVSYMLDNDSKELSITVWENDQWTKFQGYLEAMADHDLIDVSTYEVQCSTGIRVAKVESVNLRCGNLESYRKN